MSRIDELLEELCPDGVEYKAIGDFGELVRGNGMPKTDFVESGVGCIHYGQIYTYYGIWTKSTKSFVSEAKAERLAKVDPGDLIITNTSENMADVCKAVAWLGETQIVTGGHATVLKHGQDSKYLAYYFQTPTFFADKKRHATGTKVIDVSAKSLAKIRIPLPPLDVQREIAKVLDTFTKLETDLKTELESEIEARRRQYQYHREGLFNFEGYSGESVSWTTLGEIGEFIRGTGIQKADFTESGAGCIHYGQIHTHYGTWAKKTKSFISAEFASRLRKAKTGDLVIVTTSEDDGAVAKAVAWLGDEEVAVSADAYIYRHTIDSKYLSYFFQTELFQSQKRPHITGTKVRRISGDGLAKIRIPVPSKEEQERIASILDRLDILAKDISSSLPEEIAMRRQQYAYYRDRLLSFREVA